MKLKLQIMMAAIIALTIYIPTAQAQTANLVFSGGNGTPLSITLQQSVTYTINNTQCTTSSAPFFIFDEAGNPFNFSGQSVTGTITFSINGGAAQSITAANSGINIGDISANDTYLFGNRPGAANGSMITLSAGTVTTTGNVAAAPPANGSFPTFIANNSGVRCSSAVVTAASVSISGRVLTGGGRGLSNASVYLTDTQGNTRTARTSAFGYYRFNDIAAGQTVIISVVSKRYQFAPQVVNVAEEIGDLNFVPLAPLREK